MPISLETLRYIGEAERNQFDYSPHDFVRRILGKKAIIMFVGPVATGKSYIIKSTSLLYPNEFQPAKTFTTRPIHPLDTPDKYRYIDYNDTEVKCLIEQIDKQALVEYKVHPDKYHIYGSEPADYPTHYNMINTSSNSVEYITKLPFGESRVVGFVLSVEEWATRLQQLYPNPNDNKILTKRLREACYSLEWLLDQDPTQITWIDDTTDCPLDSTCDNLVSSIKSHKVDNLQYLAENMLYFAEKQLYLK